MLRNLKNLIGYRIQTAESPGELIGRSHDFFFDDGQWKIRYLVVDTGSWLPGKKVLLAPMALGAPGEAGKTFPVKLTAEQVKRSPPIEFDMPVSRQYELELHSYYSWPFYWTTDPNASAAAFARTARDDPHLRSVREVTGYSIEAIDGPIGHVEDFIADDRSWEIRYLEVDTRNWLPARKVLLPSDKVQNVLWNQGSVEVDVPREILRQGPEFKQPRSMTPQYERQIAQYYEHSNRH